MKKYVLFIGIDMSKKWFDASLTVDGVKEQMLHKQFSNNLKGFQSLIYWISKQQQILAIQGTYLFCLEHTGIYTLPLCVFLEEHDFDYCLESALRIKRSLGIRRGKSDKADSKDIAQYAFLNAKQLKSSQLPAKELMKLKSLLVHRERLVKQRVALNNASGDYKEYMPDDYFCACIVDDNQQLIEILNTKIKKVEKLMEQIIKQNDLLDKPYKLARSVKGIGPIIATTLLVYTNCFTAFDNPKKFACYVGIAPFSKQSGSSLFINAKVSKLAYIKIKALLGNGVNSAIQHDKELRAYYQRKLDDGKNKFTVLNALKNKLISRVFATVKRGTPYVELFRYT